MTSSTAAAPRRARKPTKSSAAKAREAARRRELEDRIDVAASREALAEPGASVPADEFWKRLGR